MNRRVLEQVTAGLAVVLFIVLTLAAIVAVGDQIFNWNLFPPQIQKIIGFFAACLAIILISCVVINIMINISIIAYNHSCDKLTKKPKKS